MRSYQRSVAVGLTLLLAVASPEVVAGQAPSSGSDQAAEGYLAVVARHFQVPTGEVAILAEDGLEIEELPVLFRVSNGSGIAPSAIAAQRRGGSRWLVVAGRYGLGAGHFHVAIPTGQAGPLLERAQRAFSETEPAERDRIELSDDEIVALENVRLLSAALGASPGDVLRVRGEAGSFVEASRRLSGGP